MGLRTDKMHVRLATNATQTFLHVGAFSVQSQSDKKINGFFRCSLHTPVNTIMWTRFWSIIAPWHRNNCIPSHNSNRCQDLDQIKIINEENWKYFHLSAKPDWLSLRFYISEHFVPDRDPLCVRLQSDSAISISRSVKLVWRANSPSLCWSSSGSQRLDISANWDLTLCCLSATNPPPPSTLPLWTLACVWMHCNIPAAAPAAWWCCAMAIREVYAIWTCNPNPIYFSLKIWVPF